MQPLQEQTSSPTLDNNVISDPKTFQTSLEKPSFSPFLANSFSVEGNCGFLFGSVCFSSRHNMIIACPLDGPMQFYDAATLLPLKERPPQQLDGSIMQMSFHPETDTYIMGGPEGYIYTYNASTNELKKLKKCEAQVMAATFLSCTSYAYSEEQSKKVFLATLGTDDVVSSQPYNAGCFFLQRFAEGNLLLSGTADGVLVVHRPDRASRLPVFCSVRAHQERMFMLTLQRIVMNRKEYVLTACQDQTVKIWHLVKGRMRLLKVILCDDVFSSVMYLEDHKMLAISSGNEKIKFLRFPSGKLESTISSLGEDNTRHLFLLKEKNMIGTTSYEHGKVELIQLGGFVRRDEKKN